MHKIAASVLIAGCLFVTPAAWASGPLGDVKDYTPAEFAALAAAAQKGGVQDEIAYGKALLTRVPSQASSWFRKAGEQGSGEAWFLLAYTSSNQNDVRTGYVRAAELGYPPAFQEAFEHLLFRAAENADVLEARRLADLARLKGIKVYNPEETFATIDACYAAGNPVIPPGDIEAIKKDGRAGHSFTPNTNMMLAQAYANAWGVARNPKLALALTCHGADVPAELNAMVATLAGTMDDPELDRPFRFCDHITSGMNGGQCSAADEEDRDKERSAQLDKIGVRFAPAQKAAYTALRKAAEKYFEQHAFSEQDMSGTARASIYQDEVGREKETFLAQLRDFEDGKLPKRETLDAADRELNSVYRSTLKNYDWNDFGTLKPEGLRTTQRLWLKYRDAWAAFGAARYPKMTADGWKAWATRERVEELHAAFPPDLNK